MLVLMLLRVLVCVAVTAVVIMTAAVAMLVAVLRMFVAVLSVAVLVVRGGLSRIRFLLGKGLLKGGCYFFLVQVVCCFVNFEHELWSRLCSQ